MSFDEASVEFAFQRFDVARKSWLGDAQPNRSPPKVFLL
jgi:hypothetical protein